jgi:RNA polymerase subunit RPABC4/transcription elongation factor Spt4
MKVTLEPCARCHRHVRATEGACPFCEAPPPRERRVGWLGAALATGLTVSAASSLVGCDAASVARAQVDEDAVRLTPQYGAPSDPYPPPPPPPRDDPDAGKPRP